MARSQVSSINTSGTIVRKRRLYTTKLQTQHVQHPVTPPSTEITGVKDATDVTSVICMDLQLLDGLEAVGVKICMGTCFPCPLYCSQLLPHTVHTHSHKASPSTHTLPASHGPYKADRPQIYRRQGPSKAAGHQGCAQECPHHWRWAMGQEIG